MRSGNGDCRESGKYINAQKGVLQREPPFKVVLILLANVSVQYIVTFEIYSRSKNKKNAKKYCYQ